MACTICSVPARLGFTTCGAECQAIQECTNAKCACQLTTCLNCQNGIKRGLVFCSLICEQELEEKCKSLTKWVALTRPHFAA